MILLRCFYKIYKNNENFSRFHVSLGQKTSTSKGTNLIDRSKKKSEDFLSLFHKHKNLIFDFTLKILGDEHMASDVTQDVFLRLFKSMGKSRKIENAKGWLFITARNLCLNKIRDGRKEVSLHSIPEETLGYDNNPDRNRIILAKSLLSLDTKYREALILKEYQGFSYKEIAEILQITVPAVRSLLFNARTRLKDNFHKINNGRLIK